MPKDNPMKERRDAIDLAIAALDEQRRRYIPYGLARDDKVVAINRAIQILTAMREEGPLL